MGIQLSIRTSTSQAQWARQDFLPTVRALPGCCFLYFWMSRCSQCQHPWHNKQNGLNRVCQQKFKHQMDLVSFLGLTQQKIRILGAFLVLSACMPAGVGHCMSCRGTPFSVAGHASHSSDETRQFYDQAAMKITHSCNSLFSFHWSFRKTHTSVNTKVNAQHDVSQPSPLKLTAELHKKYVQWSVSFHSLCWLHNCVRHQLRCAADVASAWTACGPND